jgi:phosphonate transport system permease protein
MTTSFRDATLSERNLLRSRHPNIFNESMGQRVVAIVLIAAMLALAVYAFIRLEISFERFGAGLGQMAHMIGMMFPPTPGTRLPLYLHALGETVAIALLGTLTAAVFAFPIGFLAAKNVVPNIFAHFAVRRMLDTIRGVDTLIWALIFINVVGLGPFAGVLAIAVSDFGSFGKLFSEAIETSSEAPVEGVVSTGGSKLHTVRFALMPQVFPVIASQVLYYFEANTRSATIIGIVGAGGIGMHLSEQIRVLEWGHVAFLVLMILVTVAVIDWVSSRLRFAIIGRSPVRL